MNINIEFYNHKKALDAVFTIIKVCFSLWHRVCNLILRTLNYSLMKTLRLLFGIMLLGLSLSSCVEENNYYEDPGPTLEEIMTQNEIWYVDYNRTTGYGNVPFVSRAFTLSFDHGKMYANNNIVGLGFSGSGFGIQTGFYDTHTGLLEIDHDIDGHYKFEVIVISTNHIRLYNAYQDVTYFLEGYSRDTFDYDQVFYDNIEYFLQEYDAWRKVDTSLEGEINDFDYENYLAFTPENITTFYSSQDEEGLPLSSLIWDFEGNYEIFDVNGSDDLKILTLDYDAGYNEEFELHVVDDVNIELYHYNSGTTYSFEGDGYIQYKNKSLKTRARKIVKRKSMDQKPHKAVKLRKK